MNCGKRELPRAQLDALISRGAGARRQGPRLGVPRGRRLALADGEVPDRPRSSPRSTRRSAPPRATCCCSSPTSPPSPTRCSAPCATASPSAGTRSREGAHALCWIVDWPLFELERGREGRWDPLHHPFTALEGELDDDDPGAARAQAYDLVWNGWEIGGGSIRISDPRRSGARLRRCSGSTPRRREARFGFLLEALRYGAPPHGGIAYGVDRICGARRRRRLDPRRDRLPEDVVRRRPADRSAGAGRRRPAARPRDQAERTAAPARQTDGRATARPGSRGLAAAVVAAINSPRSAIGSRRCSATTREVVTGRNVHAGPRRSLAWAGKEYDHLVKRYEIDESAASGAAVLGARRGPVRLGESGEVADSSPIAIVIEIWTATRLRRSRAARRPAPPPWPRSRPESGHRSPGRERFVPEAQGFGLAGRTALVDSSMGPSLFDSHL